MNINTERKIERPWRAWHVLLFLATLAVFATLVLWPTVGADSRWFADDRILINDLKRMRAGGEIDTAGVVTFINPQERVLYLQDQTAGLRIQLEPTIALPRLGDRIALRATVLREYDARVGLRSVQLGNISIDTLDHQGLPAAERLPLPELFSATGLREARRIETTGIVSAAYRHEHNRIWLELGDNGQRMPVVVLNMAHVDPESLIDAKITVRGALQLDFVNEASAPQLWVASGDDLEITERPSGQIATAPSIRSLIIEPQWVANGHRVRVHGRVVRADSDRILIIENGALTMPVEIADARRFAAGEWIEVVGWPTRRRFTIVLDRAEASALKQAQAPRWEEPAEAALTSIAEVRGLGNEAAGQARPVDIVAVLTSIHYQRDCFFVQFGEYGIYVDSSSQAIKHLRSGQRVRLQGLTWPGGFAPVIIHPRVTVLGEGELPVAQQVEPEIAPSGTYDSEWVEIEGLVRPMKHDESGAVFNLITAVGPVSALLVESETAESMQRLVDARVRVRGVFATSFTNDRVLTGYRIFVQSLDHMQIVRPAQVNPMNTAPRAIKDLLRFSAEAGGGRRARVQGVVTLRKPGQVYIEDDSGSLQVQASDAAVLPGELIEAIGYPTPSDSGPVLTDAVVRALGTRKEIEPKLVTPEQVLTGNWDNHLVRMEGRLLSQASGATQQTLVIQSGYTTFNAQLDDGVSLAHLREGSIVSIVGICIVQRQRPFYRDYNSVPTSFRLLMRSPQDVSVLHQTAWWNLRHAWPALAMLTLSILLAMLWVAVLRRRVQVQTAEIESQRAFLRQVIDICPNFIFVKDRHGRFTLVNRAIAEAHGLRPEDMVGRTDREVGLSESETAVYLADDRQVLETKQEKVITDEAHTDNAGRQLCLHTVKRPLLDEHGNATHVLGVSNDITLHKQAERTLLSAREAAEAANRAKSEFLANMSHEIRTPLNGILGMSELCLDTDLSPEQREYLETVKLSADGLLTVINDILDFSKIEAGKLQLDALEFDVRDTLDGALKTLALRAHQKGLELISDVAPDVPQTVLADGNRLRQVVLNLVGNAVKFTERGEVSIRAVVESREGDECVLHFTVADTGIGIPADRQEHIFSPFVQADSSTTRQYGGTGLGLTISTRLVTMMGGRIWLESEVGKGSRFHFTVRVRQVQSTARNDSSAEAPQLRGVRVLIVDDNETNRRILNDALTRWHMQCVVAASADEALRRLEESAQIGAPFQLLLTDLNMPDVDGLTLVERIREHRALSATVLMMLSSSGQREEAARCRTLGIQSYLVKPIRLNDLREAIVRALTPSMVHAVHARRARIATGGALNILLAEDNAVNQLVMQRMLAKRGHRVTLAKTGRAALEACSRERFDLVFMDVQMPELDGFEATRELRRREHGSEDRMPIVALTAHAMAGDRERCLAAGMDGYMTKPINPKELDRVLTQWGASSGDHDAVSA